MEEKKEILVQYNFVGGGGILFALLALMKIPAFINSIRASMVYEYYPITYSISALLFIIGSILISIYEAQRYYCLYWFSYYNAKQYY